MVRVSIIIRTKDKADTIEVVLRMVYCQTFGDFEVIVVDSGSTDSTLEIVRQFPAKILQIKPEEFTYGYSMNVGCQAARGDYFVALSAHCIPRSASWLEALIAPFRDARVAGVTSCGMRGRVEQDVNSFMADPGCGLSNGNSAYRMDLWRKKPFDEAMLGCEDKDWELYFLNRGYITVQVPGAGVLQVLRMNSRDRFRKSYVEYHGFAQFLDDSILRRMLWCELKKLLTSPSRWEMCRFFGSYIGAARGRQARMVRLSSVVEGSASVASTS